MQSLSKTQPTDISSVTSPTDGSLSNEIYRNQLEDSIFHEIVNNTHELQHIYANQPREQGFTDLASE